jgi:hypothetical protein
MFFSRSLETGWRSRVGKSALVWLMGFVGAMPVRGDVFVLKNGARLQGDWLNADQAPIRQYVVHCQPGFQITLDQHQVSEHIREPSAIAEYERFAPTRADTVADQWSIAEWCRIRGMQQQRQQHLWRILELEPDHQAARQALGFSVIDGKWVTTKDFFQDRGFVYYQGKWRLPQEVDLIEERRQLERKERDWFSRLKTLRGQLGTERDAEAVKNLAAIHEPTALKAVADNLRREKSPRVRLLLVGVLANIRSAPAIELLVQTALNDADPEIFHTCADKLVAMQSPGLSKVLTEVLRDSNNRRVNRAAHLLGRIGDRKSIPALAAALVTTHQIAIPPQRGTNAMFAQPATSTSGPSNNASMTSIPGGGMSFSAGRQPKSLAYQVANQEVLGALVKLSDGQSFGFDQRAWLNWWASASRTQ